MTALEHLKENKSLLKNYIDSNDISCDFETLTEKNLIKLNRYKNDPGVSEVYLWGMANNKYDFIWGTTINDFLNTVFYLVEHNKKKFLRNKKTGWAKNYQANKTFWFVNLPFDYAFMKNELYKLLVRFDGEMNDFKDFCLENKERGAYMITGHSQQIIQVWLFIKGKFARIKCVKRLTNLSVKKMGEEVGIQKLTPIDDEEKFYDAIDKVYSRDELYDKIYNVAMIHVKPFDARYGYTNNKYLNLMLPYLKNDCIIPLKYLNDKFRKMISGLNDEFVENCEVKKVLNLKQALTSSSLSITGLKNYYGKSQFKREFKNVLTVEEHYMVDKSYQGGLSSFNPNNKNKKGQVIAIDINSSYPYEMMKALPYGLPLDEKPEGESVKFINVTIKSFKSKYNKQHIPLIKSSRIPSEINKTFRYLYEYNGKPYNTTYIFNELELIKKYYVIDYKIEKTIWFKMKPFAKDYLAILKQIKINAKNEDQKNASKIILNSLYGKFGEKVHLSKKRSVDLTNKKMVADELDFIDNHFWVTSHINNFGLSVPMISDMKTLNLNDLLKNKKPFSKHNWPGITFLRNDRLAFEYEYNQRITPEDVKTRHIGAYITWKAREHLIKTIELFNWSDIKYYDTDSIYFFGKKIPDELNIDDKEFGAWSVDGKYENMDVLGAKMYKLVSEDGDIKIKFAGVFNAGEVFADPDNRFNIGVNLIGVSLKKIQLDNGIVLTRRDHQIQGGEH